MEFAAEKYSQYCNLNLNTKLEPIHQCIDETLTRLDEFQTMLTILQENRGKAIGTTGSLSQTTEKLNELKELCKRIDALEVVVKHIKCNVDDTEKKLDAIEEQFGMTAGSSKIKNFMKPFFKKNLKGDTTLSEVGLFSSADYFDNDSVLQDRI